MNSCGTFALIFILIPSIYSIDKTLKTNTWLNEKEYRVNQFMKEELTTNKQETYFMGWHIFLDKEDARNNKKDREYYVAIKKVKFKNVVATGVEIKHDKEYEIVVAKDMFIL